jgi:hypothetical protein
MTITGSGGIGTAANKITFNFNKASYFLVVLLKKMLTKSSPISTQSNLFHSELFSQLDVLILAGKTKNLFDKFQTGCVCEVCVAIL